MGISGPTKGTDFFKCLLQPVIFSLFQICCPALDTVVDVKHLTNRETVLREISMDGKGDEVTSSLSASLSSSGQWKLSCS